MNPEWAKLQPPRNIVPRVQDLSSTTPQPWSDRSVHECFALRSVQFLDETALLTDEAEFTYRQLARLADQVAHIVHARVGSTGQPVALMLEHEAPVPAAILGVLKTGSFNVPLDPTYPAERNRYVLEDSTATLVITNERNAQAVAALGIPRRQILNLDEIASGNVQEFTSPPVGPDDLTWLLYTSGSTGRPKGVMRTHRSLLHHLRHQSPIRLARAGDRIGLLFSYSGGASMGNVFGALLNGATLAPFNVGAAGVGRLAEWLRDRAITSFHTVPTIFRHLTEVLTDVHEFPHLRHIQLGGERMFATDLARFKKHFGDHSKLIVGMGTGEAGHLFSFVADKDTECVTDALPVGYAVDDRSIFLVDADGARVGPNRLGEIVVRGDFVSPGYWRQPELTARKFRPDSDSGAVRTFFTGDLGYMLSDGCVFFAGRTDERVKIRGQAVEVAEIEAALLRIPGVTQAAVVAHGEPPKLVAFVVARPGSRPSYMDLRASARQTLPDTMVPSAFVVLDALPLLPNGKVDRPTLVRDASARPVQSSFVAPRNAIEQSLANLYAEVLDLEQVGIDDNFFEIGGHSLPAMQMLAKVEATLGKRLTPDALLTMPTVRELAGALTEKRASSRDCSSLIALQVQGSRPPFFWIHGEKSNAFLASLLGPDQPLYGLVQQSIDGRPAFHKTVPDIATYYRRAMESVQPKGPYFLGGFCVGAIVAFEVAQQLQREGHEVRLLTLLDPPYRVFPSQWRVPKRFRTGALRLVPGLFTLLETAARCRQMAVLRTAQRFALAREAAQRIGHAIRGTEHSIPHNERVRYINAIYSRARRRYVPATYAGRIVILKTEGSFFDPERIWSELATGGVDVHTLPGPHDDIVFVEARIQAVGATLKECLLEAQRAPASPPSRHYARD